MDAAREATGTSVKVAFVDQDHTGAPPAAAPCPTSGNADRAALAPGCAPDERPVGLVQLAVGLEEFRRFVGHWFLTRAEGEAGGVVGQGRDAGA